MAKPKTFTVNQLHKQLGKLIDKGNGRTPVCIDKSSFHHPLESDGCVILNAAGFRYEYVLQLQDDGSHLDNNGREHHKRCCILFGESVHPYKGVLSTEAVEEYIRKLEWSENTPDIQKSLVIGNIRGFAQYLREATS